jgi:LuxR family quorum sensing-dependent transcriptional regulator
MTVNGDVYGKRTLDFVERLQKLDSYDDICRQIASEMEWFGFSYVSSWSMPGPGDVPSDCLLLNTRPQDYVEHYIEKNYMIRDPVVTELRTNLTPFSWNDLRGRRNLSKGEKAIMDESRDRRLYRADRHPIRIDRLIQPVRCGSRPVGPRPRRH